MKEQFGATLDLEIHLNGSEAAQGHILRGSTTVLVNNRWVPLEIATSRGRMASYLSDEIERIRKAEETGHDTA